MAVTVVVTCTPVLQKAEKCRFYQENGGCYKGTMILTNSFPIRCIPFKYILYVLKKHLFKEKNECEITLALYIRLEYRTDWKQSTVATEFMVYSRIKNAQQQSSR